MLGVLGHPALRQATPNVDRLAREGTLFENAYCTHPICCPSRANMWSGLYTHHCESWNNHKGLETQMWSLLSHLPQTHELGTFGKLNTSGYMLRKDRWKYVAYVGYPSQLFDIEADPGELHDLAAEEPETAKRLDADLRAIVDIDQTHRDVMAYNREAFRQWRRQAKRGLYLDRSYGLRDHPSSDYMTIMRNAFAGYDEADERKVDAWLAQL
jgi:arylsulfatase A-like enzyme